MTTLTFSLLIKIVQIAPIGAGATTALQWKQKTKASVATKCQKLDLNALISNALRFRPVFENVCLHRDVLETALCAISDIRCDSLIRPIPSRTFRLAAYRQFSWWMQTRLGRNKRMKRFVIPACVIRAIKKAYPEASGI